jgi:hypothetical protein
MHKDLYLHVIYPQTDEEKAQVPQEMLTNLEEELKFLDDYRNRTGLHWRHYFGNGKPRDPPVLYMWPANEVGQKHHVVSDQGYWYGLLPRIPHTVYIKEYD